MGIVKNSYRLPKDALWPTLLSIREYYLEYWPPLQLFRQECGTLQGSTGALKALEKVEEGSQHIEHFVELQLLDEDDHYLVRPMESGNFFHGNSNRWPALEPVFIGSGSSDSRRVAEWSNRQVALRRFLIYLVISKADYADVAYWSIRRMVG